MDLSPAPGAGDVNSQWPDDGRSPGVRRGCWTAAGRVPTVVLDAPELT